MTTSSEHTPGPWEIVWYICRMNEGDVRHAKASGNATAKAGDEMWRVPLSIGPVSAAHCHWAGAHIDCNTEANARLVAAAPRLLGALRQMVAMFDSEIHDEYDGTSLLADRLAEADFARAVIAEATGEQT